MHSLRHQVELVIKLNTLTPLLGLCLALFAARSHCRAAEYFVDQKGSDVNAGTSREAAFATIQKGVDALLPGDTLTIAPGEYPESVKRADLGSLDCETIIRAEIPGTVTLRGDVRAPEFRPLAGTRFTYVADFDFAGPISAVNEIDTLTILRRMPNAAEAEFIPGTFFHDTASGKLYLSTSDFRPADAHHYSVSVRPTHGILLIRPRRVVVEGLNFTGFSATELLHYREETAGGVWGLFVVHGKSCTVRNCRAYLNAWGIGFNSIAEGSGDNLIEHCAAWGNKSAFANGDMGGITAFNARRDVIRNSTAYRNGMYGINIYGTGGALPHSHGDGNLEKNKSRLEHNLSWGNETADFKIKTGYEYFHVVEHCASPGKWSVTNVSHGTIGVSVATQASTARDDIFLNEEAMLDLGREFADPANHDYHLQADSRFRAKDSEGEDRGAFPYSPNIFYVRPDGNDEADGLSVVKAWKTLARAAANLRPGDTVYLEPGRYVANFELRAAGETDAPICIRGRGDGVVELSGNLKLKNCRSLRFERLTFHDGVYLDRGGEIVFDNATFRTPGASVQASEVRGLEFRHCTFAAFKTAAIETRGCSRIDLRGNLFHNAEVPAMSLDDDSGVRYSNYNAYHRADAAWEVGGRMQSLDEVRKTHDRQSVQIESHFVGDQLTNAAQFAGRGPLGKPIGRYRDEPRRSEMRLVAGPTIHSVSATTADIEWVASSPATCAVAWGETPACENSRPFDVNCFGTFSLAGLKAGKTYYFRIRSLETPRDMLPKTEHQSVALDDEPIAFTTLARNADPENYYVAPDGDDANTGRSRENAWKTIRHAAAMVNVGDTVWIAGGTYRERVRLRVSGDEGLPISFRALPGERVELNGDGMLLNSGFVAGGKSHLQFDGFYFANFNLFPNDGWSLTNNGEFQLYSGHDIEISRCFSEGRGGYSAAPVAAYYVEDLVIRNCVNTYKFGGMYFWRCPNLLIENTVFAEPMIMAFVLRNEKDQRSLMRNCIFTDMLDKKARLNLGILCCDGAIEGFRQQDNCYYLRDCIPLSERALQGNSTASQLTEHVRDPVFADPLFAGDPGARDNPSDKSGFSCDRLMEPTLRLDFDSFYAMNSELTKRGIGLQPDAFADFHFNSAAAEAASGPASR